MRVFALALVLGTASLGLVVGKPGKAQECEPYAVPAYYPPVTSQYEPPGMMECEAAPPMAGPPSPALTDSYGPRPIPATAAYCPQPRPSHTVELGAYDNYFGPDAVSVAPGTTVRWINYGQHRHTVTSYTGLFDSGEFGPGGVFSFTFTQPGTYYYYCRVHPREMRGTIVVR